LLAVYISNRRGNASAHGGTEGQDVGSTAFIDKLILAPGATPRPAPMRTSTHLAQRRAWRGCKGGRGERITLLQSYNGITALRALAFRRCRQDWAEVGASPHSAQLSCAGGSSGARGPGLRRHGTPLLPSFVPYAHRKMQCFSTQSVECGEPARSPGNQSVPRRSFVFGVEFPSWILLGFVGSAWMKATSTIPHWRGKMVLCE